MERYRNSYYEYVWGQISREELQVNSSIKDEGRFALEHARCATLGETPTRQVNQRIREALQPWPLGPDWRAAMSGLLPRR